ncbi:MAG: hypothetical protein ACI88H_003277 [Cocleimonas sp.]|jgi:uncharacterized protein with ParB-like and HNH nuclease domain
MDVKPNYCSLETVFSENTLYEVPMFQRAYSWKNENVIQFTSDIENLYTNIQQNGGDDSHFFGGIVCVKQKNKDVLDEKTIYQLVDGQQRLSTTVLLVSRLIKYLRSLKLTDEQSGIRERRIQKYKNKYLEFKSEENGKDVLFSRISLSRRDRDFYEAYVIKSQNINAELESHKLIMAAALKIDHWLRTFFQNCPVEEILSKSDIIFRVLSTACRILMIKMSDVNDAYRLFQVINDRGRSLTAGDLLRAASLGAYDSVDGVDKKNLIELENKWDHITRGDSNNTNNKLIAYYTSKVGKACRKITLFEEFNKEFFSDTSKIKEQIEEVDKQLKLYDNLHNGIWPYKDSSLSGFQKRKLQNITVIFKHTHGLPLLMAASQLKEKKFYQIVYYLEKFFFIFRVALEKRMTPVTKLYFETIKQINRSSETYQVQHFLNGLKKIIGEKITKAEFDTYLESLQYVKDGDNRHIKYLLSNIEENWNWISIENINPVMMYKKAFRGLADNSFIFSIEHIYPKNAKTSEKNQKLEPLKHSLGNLALLYDQDNSAFENEHFNIKKEQYGKSRLNSTMELQHFAQFEHSDLSGRYALCCKRLTRIFFLGE